MPTARDVMKQGPVIPVVKIEQLDQAVPMAEALLAGGIRVIEVTMRTAQALACVSEIRKRVPEALVGVGTLTRPEHFAQARDAGGLFTVSPGSPQMLLDAANDCGLPFLPGVMTPSDVIRATAAGFSALKLFPAEQAGGVAMLKALHGPFPELVFCPTGGVTLESMPHYLSLGFVPCIGGSWLTPAELMRGGDWPAITRLAKQASTHASY